MLKGWVLRLWDVQLCMRFTRYLPLELSICITFFIHISSDQKLSLLLQNQFATWNLHAVLPYWNLHHKYIYWFLWKSNLAQQKKEYLIRLNPNCYKVLLHQEFQEWLTKVLERSYVNSQEKEIALASCWKGNKKKRMA